MYSTALGLAAKVFAKYMRAFALSEMRSTKTAAAVEIKRISANTIDVNAGRAVPEGPDDKGPWGWEPIQAYMFETKSKHPLFGDEERQYHQPYRPILNKTAMAGIDEAERAYASQRIRELAAQFGYK